MSTGYEASAPAVNEQGAVVAGVLKSSREEPGRSGVGHPTVEKGGDVDEVGPAILGEGLAPHPPAAGGPRGANAIQGAWAGHSVSSDNPPGRAASAGGVPPLESVTKQTPDGVLVGACVGVRGGYRCSAVPCCVSCAVNV